MYYIRNPETVVESTDIFAITNVLLKHALITIKNKAISMIRGISLASELIFRENRV